MLVLLMDLNSSVSLFPPQLRCHYREGSTHISFLAVSAYGESPLIA